MGSLLKVEGRRIVRDGQEVRLRGVNYGNWMLIEAYMIGLPWTEYRMRQGFLDTLGREAYDAFFGTFMEAFVTDADVAFLAANGFNFVRLPFNYRYFGCDATCRGFGDGFAHVDRFLDLCGAHGVYVLLDMHAGPGCQARDWNAESAFGEAFLWDHEHFVDVTAGIWRDVAARYRDDDRVFGYEALGEPVAPDPDGFHAFNMRMIEAIRSVDSQHIVAVESNDWGQRIESLRDEVFDDPLVIPSLHFYPTNKFPFDRLTEYPGEWEGKRYGRDELVALLDGYYDDRRIQRPMLAGEFGVPRFRGERSAAMARMLRDMVGFFEEKGWSWATWAHKDLGALGLLRPKADTPWRRFLEGEPVKSLRGAYRRCAGDFRAALHEAAPELTEKELGLFIGQARHHWDAAVLPHVLEQLRGRSTTELEEMARSFAFENCEVDEDRLAALTAHA
jgi:endoglucanase